MQRTTTVMTLKWLTRPLQSLQCRRIAAKATPLVTIIVAEQLLTPVIASDMWYVDLSSVLVCAVSVRRF